MRVVVVHVHRHEPPGEWLDCGLRLGVGRGRSPFTLKRIDFLNAVMAGNLTGTIKLRFGEGARICERCRGARGQLSARKGSTT